MHTARSGAQPFTLGARSTLSSFKGFIDPLAILAMQALAWRLHGQPLDRFFLLVALLTFSLTYPGKLPFRRRPRRMPLEILVSWLPAVLSLLLLGWVTDTLGQFDRDMLAAWFAGTPVGLYALHRASPWLMRRVSILQQARRAVVVGANPLGLRLAGNVNKGEEDGLRVVAYFDDRSRARLGDTGTVPLAGRLQDLADYVRQQRIDQILITLPMASQPRILALLDALRDTTASVYFVPDVFMSDLIQARMDTVGNMPVIAVCESPFYGTAGVVKRWSDLVIASVAIVLTSPVMLATAAAIKWTSPGPVLFRQRRYGLDGEEILVWKFRSMRVQDNGAVVRQATKNDDRVTPVGRFIRRTSIDELPQFFNVLQGRMSVVGPRPHAVAHNEMYRKLIKGYMVRHKVKPGITGLAQVSGARGETETVEKMQMRIDYDLQYLRNWSLKLDLRIVLRTVVQAVRRDPNVY